MSNEEKHFHELEKQLKDALMKAAKERGIDAAQMKDVAVHVERRDANLHLKWGDVVEVNLPAPSQEAVDSLFKQFGGVIVGAILTLVSVTVGAGLMLASGGARRPPDE